MLQTTKHPHSTTATTPTTHTTTSKLGTHYTIYKLDFNSDLFITNDVKDGRQSELIYKKQVRLGRTVKCLGFKSLIYFTIPQHV